MATKNSTYVRIATLDIVDVIEAIRYHHDRFSPRNKEFKQRFPVMGYHLKLDSLRLKTFMMHGTRCSCCGLEASFFAVEKHKSADQNLLPHLNLWGVDANGEEVLFTHDHTLARSLGGADKLYNTTTMCSICNEAKSVEERILKEELLKKAS